MDTDPGRPGRLGRTLREVLTILLEAPRPDPQFADDLEAILATVGGGPPDPWASGSLPAQPG